MGNPHRLRIIAELSRGRVHVSELARRLGMSRPLLYMHLDKLEKAGLVIGQLELSEDGKAMKYYELAPFDLRLTAEKIVAALAADGAADGALDADGAGDAVDEVAADEAAATETGNSPNDKEEGARAGRRAELVPAAPAALAARTASGTGAGDPAGVSG